MTAQIVQLLVPWWDHMGELEYQPMTFSHPQRVDRKVVFRAIRRWYKNAIGRSITKDMMQSVWQRRHTTYAMTEATIQQKLQDMAHETYLYVTNPDFEKEDTGEAE